MTPRSILLVLPLLALLAGPDPSAAAQTRAFVLTSDFATGGLSVVDLDSRAVSPDVEPACPDAQSIDGHFARLASLHFISRGSVSCNFSCCMQPPELPCRIVHPVPLSPVPISAKPKMALRQICSLSAIHAAWKRGSEPTAASSPF